MIVGDNGTTYKPTTPLNATFQQSGLKVFFAGIPLGGANGATLLYIATISVR